MRPPCLLCGGRIGMPVSDERPALCCEACRQQLPWYTAARCPQCAMPSPQGLHCGSCLQHPPAFDATMVAFRYAYPLNQCLQRFKYHQSLPVGAWLISEWLAVVAPPMQQFDVVMAMPMHASRLRARGFQHAALLAEHVSAAWQTPVANQLCERVKATPLLEGLSVTDRAKSLRGAFSCHGQLHGQHVLMVDDVMTTGASMHALAAVVKRAGAQRVTALVLARTLKD